MGVASRVRLVGAAGLRVVLAVVILWHGGMKFTSFEAESIEPLVSNSPLLSWTYRLMSVTQFSSALGVVELVIGVLLLVHWWVPAASTVGAGMAVGMFATTLSFLVTTPGAWEASLGGFPAVGLLTGFLLKDGVLLLASVMMAGESLGRWVTGRVER